MFQYTPRHFATHEIVPPQVWEDRGDKALHLMNPHILEVADFLRLIYGPAFINTYKLSSAVQAAYGHRQHSGLRLPDSPYYRPYSQHSYGNAVDMLFRDITAEEIRKDVQEGKLVLPHPVVFEKDVAWLHVACANYSGLVTMVDG